MKKCNYCNNNLEDNQKYCIKCGMTYVDENIKNKGKKFALLFFSLLLAFIFMFVFYFASTNHSTKLIEIGEFKNTIKDNDLITNQFYKIDDFTNAVYESDKYIEGINLFSNKLIDSLPEKSDIIHDFQASVTMGNNIYFENIFTVNYNNYNLKITFNHDLYNQINDVNIDLSLGKYDNFESMLLEKENLNWFNQTLIELGYVDYSLDEIFDNLQDTSDIFELRKEKLGNYGITSNTTFSHLDNLIVITSYKEQYILKLSIKTELDNQFLY